MVTTNQFNANQRVRRIKRASRFRKIDIREALGSGIKSGPMPGRRVEPMDYLKPPPPRVVVTPDTVNEAYSVPGV